MRRLMQSEQMTDIVEVPAIAVNGTIKVQTPELAKLSLAQLKEWATVMGGEVLWVKMRITYSESETALCCTHDCWRPAKTIWCEDCENKSHQTAISVNEQTSQQTAQYNNVASLIKRPS